MINSFSNKLLIDEMPKTPLLKYHNNALDYNTVSDILTDIWTLLEEHDVGVSNIKKVYSIATECLENIYKHSDFVDIADSIKFELQIENGTLEIVSSNPVENSKTSFLHERITFLNGLNKVGLKKLYQYEIKKRGMTVKGGAGLGLIIIARKSESYTCEIIALDNSIDSFILKISVSL